MYAPPLPTTPARSLGRMAGLFRALADETRLGILVRLRDGEQCVCDLADALDAGQSRLSFHLKTLKDGGLRRRRRQGRWVDFALVREAVAGALDALEALG